MSIKLAIVDDEELILEGIKLLLSLDQNIKVKLTASDGLSFLDRLAELTEEDFPDIVLVDIQMQPMDGFQVVEKLRGLYPHLKIMILSSHYKTSILVYMVKLGVSAFLPKNSNKATFIEAITQVYKNGVYFTAEDYSMLNTYMNNPPKQNTLFEGGNELTDREKEIVKLICEELTNQQIAEKLCISPRTVETHRQRILDKIGAKNTVGIVIYAIVNQIYDPNLKLS